MIDVADLMAQLRRRRKDLGLTQREVVQHAPGFTTSLLSGYETGQHKPSAEKLVVLANALGCDLTLTPRPAPPLRTRFDSLDELRQDMHDNAWARRVAALATPDDLEELKRRLVEYKAAESEDDDA